MWKKIKLTGVDKSRKIKTMPWTISEIQKLSYSTSFNHINCLKFHLMQDYVIITAPRLTNLTKRFFLKNLKLHIGLFLYRVSLNKFFGRDSGTSATKTSYTKPEFYKNNAMSKTHLFQGFIFPWLHICTTNQIDAIFWRHT